MTAGGTTGAVDAPPEEESTAAPPPGALSAIAAPSVGLQPRSLDWHPRTIDHPLARGRYQTPLRYPGAKSALAPLIRRIIASAAASTSIGAVDLLVEPFAGGASSSLRLVGDGTVRRVLLADADPLVAAFWQEAAANTGGLIDRMYDEYDRYVAPGGQTALERWDYWRNWQPSLSGPSVTRRHETAMKCLFLNRTTFSGILHGRAGPIGGRRQASRYSIGCRFNPDALANRIRYVGHLYDTGRLVDVWWCDWQKTLEDVPERYPNLIPSKVVAYLDPPYIEKSGTLYSQSFSSSNVSDGLAWVDAHPHYRLADHLRRKMQFRWLLSYDAQPELLTHPQLYAAGRMTPTIVDKRLLGIREWRISKRFVSLSYTASRGSSRPRSEELLITTLPPNSVPPDDDIRLVRNGAG